MAKTKILGLDKFLKDIKSEVSEYWVKVQNDRLVEYAKKTIQDIGDKIQTYNSRNHMDRTGNLLDSLCWCVSYNGKVVESGFYREQQASQLSYLHEWFRESYDGFPVGGHVLAANFIKRMSNLVHSGWRIFFAVLAPYWGYWEEGFKMKLHTPSYQEEDAVSYRFMRFAVMTQFYDRIASDLKPAKVTFKTKAPTYDRADLERVRDKRDERKGRGGFSVYDKYPKGKGKGQYDY